MQRKTPITLPNFEIVSRQVTPTAAAIYMSSLNYINSLIKKYNKVVEKNQSYYDKIKIFQDQVKEISNNITETKNHIQQNQNILKMDNNDNANIKVFQDRITLLKAKRRILMNKKIAPIKGLEILELRNIDQLIEEEEEYKEKIKNIMNRNIGTHSLQNVIQQQHDRISIYKSQFDIIKTETRVLMEKLNSCQEEARKLQEEIDLKVASNEAMFNQQKQIKKRIDERKRKIPLTKL